MTLENYFFSANEGESVSALLNRYLEHAEQTLDAHAASGRNLCALLHEPCCVIPGLYAPNKEYMKGLYE